MNNLKLIKSMLEETMKGKPVNYEIKETYLDYGAGMKHTTIIAYTEKGSSWQIFSPKDLEKIEDGSYTLDSFNQLIKKHEEMIK